MNDTACAETPLRDHVARFWQHLETETVRILVDMRRIVGEDAPDGPVQYWDSATFSDEVAKALVAQRSAVEGHLHLLKAAIKAGDPHDELRFRVEEIERAMRSNP